MSERKMSGNESALSNAEQFARFKAQECGPTLAEMHPEIVEDAKVMRLNNVASKYHVMGLFNVTESIALSITAKAIQVLLSKDARNELYRERLRVVRSQLGSETGRKMKDEKRGIFGLSDEENRRNSVIGASAAGKKTKEMGTGIFGMSSEQKQDHAILANSAKKNSWFNTEREFEGMTEGDYALKIARRPEYYMKPPYEKSLDYKKIADAVNAKFGGNRSERTTQRFFERFRLNENIGRVVGTAQTDLDWRPVKSVYSETVDGMTAGQYVLYLAGKPEFQLPSGLGNTATHRPNNEKIANEMNSKFTQKRTIGAIRALLSDQKKRMKGGE